MPMRSLNAAPTFVSTTKNLRMEWDTLAKERDLKNVASKIIVDDVLLYGRTGEQLLYYLITVLDFLKCRNIL